MIHSEPVPICEEVDDILSALQLSWDNLRLAVAAMPLSSTQQCLLLYVDEGMSWKSVRDFGFMQDVFLQIDRVTDDFIMDEDVLHWVGEIKKRLSDIVSFIEEGVKI